MKATPYISFLRDDWAKLRADAPLTLNQADLEQLQGINEQLNMEEVVDIYLPLSRLLNLYISATQELYKASAEFLNNSAEKVPYIIGLAGSVAVGKSTTSRILQALLSRWSNHPKVDVVTTDGFLYPNKILERRGLMRRKGFPESFNLPHLLEFVSNVKAGQANLKIPVYSHHSYDILPEQKQVIDNPDIMIVEGLNVLQSGHDGGEAKSKTFVSDFFDFTIYVDAETKIVERWYTERFLTFRERALKDPSSFFHRFSDFEPEQVMHYAREIWRGINELNLLENILPTRERARLILFKGADHSVQRVNLRKL